MTDVSIKLKYYYTG